MAATGLNSPKKVIKNQKYEEYWKSTLAVTAFFSPQFIRTLQLAIEHIDKYELYNFSDDELILDLGKKKNVLIKKTLMLRN